MSIHACGGDRFKDNPFVIGIGQNLSITLSNENNNLHFYIYYNEHEYKYCDESESEMFMMETVTFVPEGVLKLTSQDFVMISNYSKQRYDTLISENIEKKGYNIFGNEIRSETKYTFCFIVPTDFNGQKINDISYTMFIFNKFSLCP